MNSSHWSLPQGWATATLGEITARDVSQDGPSSSPFSYIDIASIDNETKRITTLKELPLAAAPSRAKQRLLANDVVLSMTRPNLNAVAIVPVGLNDSIGSTGLHVLRPVEVEASWLALAVQTRQFIDSMCLRVQGALYPAVRPADINSWRLPLPPAAEQRRIGAAVDELLSDLEAAVAALKRARAKLDVYRASVLRDAVEGRLTGAWRATHADVEPATALLERILVERRQRWESAQLARYREKGKEPPKNWKARWKHPPAPAEQPQRELPSLWVWATWRQVGFAQNGRPFPSRDYQVDGVRLLRPGNLFANGSVCWSARNTKRLPPIYEHENADLVVRGEELVMNLTAQSLKGDFLGRVCITSPDEHCLLNQRLARLTPVSVDQRFALWLLKAPRFRRFVAGLNSGSLIQHMFTSQLDEFRVSAPAPR